MGTDPVPFLINLYLCNNEFKHIANEVDDFTVLSDLLKIFCDLNDSGDFGKCS